MLEPHQSLPKKSQLPYALYRAEQVMAFDKAAIETYGIAGEILMERAGAAAFQLMRDRWPDARRILVLVGTGNNGGDGFVLARLAREAGLQVLVLQLGDRDKLKGDARLNAERYASAGGEWEDFRALPRETDVIVDAIFGTGLERDVTGVWAKAIEAVNQHPAPVLAVDIPSGLHSDTGNRMGVVIKADATISFIGLKQGMFTGYGSGYCGDCTFDALEIPAAVYATNLLSARRIDWGRLSQLLAPRNKLAHKGHFGHVLIVGGELGYGGAARLAGEAALRVGAGLVSVATRPEHVGAMLSARPELMVHAVMDEGALEQLLRNCSVIAVGPGLGRSDWGRMLWRQIMDSDKPKVVDADALNLLAEYPVQQDNWVLTPHPGEASRLLDVCMADIMQDRFAIARQLQQRYGGVTVLKGAGTLVAGRGERPLAVCSQGNPGMASGGMGDVLTGVIAGLMAQGFSLQDSTEMGVCLHAAAADEVAKSCGERGMLASDLMAPMQRLMNPC